MILAHPGSVYQSSGGGAASILSASAVSYIPAMEDSTDVMNKWRRKIKGQLTNPVLPGK